MNKKAILLAEKNVERSPEEAPIIPKVVNIPRQNISVYRNILSCDLFSPAFAIYPIYSGMTGNTHGEKKDKSPSKNIFIYCISNLL